MLLAGFDKYPSPRLHRWLLETLCRGLLAGLGRWHWAGLGRWQLARQKWRDFWRMSMMNL